jgi:hypothetical protein
LHRGTVGFDERPRRGAGLIGCQLGSLSAGERTEVGGNLRLMPGDGGRAGKDDGGAEGQHDRCHGERRDRRVASVATMIMWD